MRHYAIDENYTKGKGLVIGDATNENEEQQSSTWKRVDGEIIKLEDMTNDQVIIIWQSLVNLKRDSLNHSIRFLQQNNIAVGTDNPGSLMSESDRLEFDVEVANYQYADKWLPVFESEIRDARKMPYVLVI
jgi:hypothetical protein